MKEVAAQRPTSTLNARARNLRFRSVEYVATINVRCWQGTRSDEPTYDRRLHRYLPFVADVGKCAALIVSFSLAALGDAQAEAVSFSCSDSRLTVDGSVAVRWTEAIVMLCESLAVLPDLDAHVAIRIVASGRDVILEATLTDGRTALRRVRAPAELGPALEALATMPPPLALERPIAPTPPLPVAVPAARAVAEVSPALSPHPPHPPHLGVELGFALDLRLEGTPSYVSTGPTGYASLRAGAWGIGFLARWQIVQSLARSAPESLEMDTVAFGFFAARRFALAPAVRLDLGLAASMLIETQSIVIDDDDELTASTVDARVGPLTRLSLGDGAWRFVVSLDADLSPSRLRRSARVDPVAPTLPSYGIGLAVGTTWGWIQR